MSPVKKKMVKKVLIPPLYIAGAVIVSLLLIVISLGIVSGQQLRTTVDGLSCDSKNYRGEERPWVVGSGTLFGSNDYSFAENEAFKIAKENLEDNWGDEQALIEAQAVIDIDCADDQPYCTDHDTSPTTCSKGNVRLGDCVFMNALDGSSSFPSGGPFNVFAECKKVVNCTKPCMPVDTPTPLTIKKCTDDNQCSTTAKLISAKQKSFVGKGKVVKGGPIATAEEVAKAKGLARSAAMEGVDCNFTRDTMIDSADKLTDGNCVLADPVENIVNNGDKEVPFCVVMPDPFGDEDCDEPRVSQNTTLYPFILEYSVQCEYKCKCEWGCTPMITPTVAPPTENSMEEGSMEEGSTEENSMEEGSMDILMDEPTEDSLDSFSDSSYF